MDLKTFDVNQYEARLREVAEGAKEHINNELDDCLHDISIAARAFAELPERVSDLMERSKAVFVTQIVLDEETPLNYLNFGFNGLRYELDNRNSTRAPPGKYRVVVALVSLDK